LGFLLAETRRVGCEQDDATGLGKPSVPPELRRHLQVKLQYARVNLMASRIYNTTLDCDLERIAPSVAASPAA
jgi:hypothetical protein